jgi:hypothetical protein
MNKETPRACESSEAWLGDLAVFSCERQLGLNPNQLEHF